MTFILLNLILITRLHPFKNGLLLWICSSWTSEELCIFISKWYVSQQIIFKLCVNLLSLLASNSSESVLFAKDVIANVSNIIRFYNLSVQARLVNYFILKQFIAIISILCIHVSKSQQFSANLIKSFVTGSLSAVLPQCNSCIFQPLQVYTDHVQGACMNEFLYMK